MNEHAYIVIPASAREQLQLRGNELLIWSIINGFSQDGESWFTGSLSYLIEWTGASKPTVINTLKSLTEKGLLIRREREISNVKTVDYQAAFPTLEPLPAEHKPAEKVPNEGWSKNLTSGKETLPPPVKKFDRGGKKILPNNIEDNINNNPPISPQGESDPQQGNTEKAKQTEMFTRFWAAYPNRKAKKNARKAWDRLKPTEQLLETILAAIEREKHSPQWQRENGRFIPLPASWLNGERWEDEDTRPAPAAESAVPPPQQQAPDRRDYAW